MNQFKVDLHTHTVLSPCGDLEMSPVNIVRKAIEKKIDILGITDHNSTKNSKVLEEIAKESGLLILKGAEVTSKEEVHCLTFFENDDELFEFQKFLDTHLPEIKNDVKKLGYQVVVDKDENIIEQVEWSLLSALNVGITEIEKKVHELNGLFIPAHIDKARYSILSQLGFIPGDLNIDALELSKFSRVEDFKQRNPELKNFTFIQSSDAHYIENIGEVSSIFQMNEKSFTEIKLALGLKDGRKVI